MQVDMELVRGLAARDAHHAPQFPSGPIFGEHPSGRRGAWPSGVARTHRLTLPWAPGSVRA